MAKRVWYCITCGYEVTTGGRCYSCGQALLESPLSELPPLGASYELGYDLGDWNDDGRGRLIQALLSAGIVHRLEDDELVILAADEARADTILSGVASPSGVGQPPPPPAQPPPLKGTWDDPYGRAWPARQVPQQLDEAPKERHVMRWVLSGVAVIVVVIVLGMIGAAQHRGSSNPSSPASTIPVTTIAPSVVPQTTEAAFIQQVNQAAKKDGATGMVAANTNCAFPKTWTPGETFNCYVYGPYVKGWAAEVGTVTIQVLTASPGDAWNANFVWTPSS
jgi:hypothetical protein